MIDLTSDTESDLSSADLSDGIATPPPPPPPPLPSSASSKRNATSMDSNLPPTKKPKRKDILMPSLVNSSSSAKPKRNSISTSTTSSTPPQNSSTTTTCHHHRRPCPSPMLECSFVRPDGKPCMAKYCSNIVKRIYDLDPDTVSSKSSTLPVDDPSHYSSLAKYAWKCPKCRHDCLCSVCRKKEGLLPLGRPIKNVSSDPLQNTTAIQKQTDASLLHQETPTQGKPTKGKVPKDKDLEVTTPPPPKSTQGTKPALPVFKRLKPPKPVDAPAVQVIPTRLPHENLRARMWLYESFVRFDKLELHKSTLNRLDKLELWTHGLVQDLFECLLRFLAGLSTIDKGQPSKHTSKSILAFRKHGKDPHRGEPWVATCEMVARLGLSIPHLESVEYPPELALAERSPSPPPLRVSRGRKAKETNKAQIARQLPLLEMWDDDDDDFDQDDPDPRPSRASRANSNRFQDFSYSETRDSHDSNAEAKPVVAQARLTDRQQILRNQQLEKQHEQPDEESDGSVGSSHQEVADPTLDHAPDLETKVAILTPLIDAALMSDELADELKTAPEAITAVEKASKADHLQMEQKMAQQLAELNKRAPLLLAPDFQAWKTEKAEMESNHAWQRLDARVMTHAQIDVHALRTGPIGYDVDGREYWHLREYNDRMPKYTEGRFSWCLVILGPEFPRNSEKQGNDTESIANDDAEYDTKRDKDSSTMSPANTDSLETPNTTSPASSPKDQANHHLYVDIPHLSPSASAFGSSRRGSPNDRKQHPQQDKGICMGTNDPVVIQSIIEYVEFRLAQREYEENQTRQDQEMKAYGAKPIEAEGFFSVKAKPKKSRTTIATQSANDELAKIKKDQQRLEDDQDERRKNVEALAKKLHKSKDFFSWHREELVE